MIKKKGSFVLIILLILPIIVLGTIVAQQTVVINNLKSATPIENKSSDVKKDEPKQKGASNKLVVWGPGKQFNEKKQPLTNLKLEEEYKDYNASFIGNTDEKEIYLTFDNGYENGYTAKVLDILKEKNVKAVFFLTYDYAKDNEELVKRMIDDGHIIGNHTYYHSSLPKVSEEKAFSNVQKQHEYMKEKFNIDMNLFRFPMGEFSDKTLKMVEDMGYKTLFWSFAYKDWDVSQQVTEEKALSSLKNGLHNGAIYLLHCVSSVNSLVLDEFIDYAISEGYTFKTN